MSPIEPTSAEPATERSLADAIAIANIPTLLMVLVQTTGDLRWLEPPYQPSRSPGLSDHDTGGLPIEVQDEIRAASLEALRLIDAGIPPAIMTPTPDLMVRMLSVSMGEPVNSDYGPMLAAEFARTVRSERRHRNHDLGHSARVLVIGAGVSGIIAAQRLQEMGLLYTQVERMPSVGGTWLQNRYPGAGVDTPNHLYSFSFAENDWSSYFELRDELYDYLERVARDLGLIDSVRFNTNVRGCTWDESTTTWNVELDGPDGSSTEEFDAIISTVGILNVPKRPVIPSLDSFGPNCFHTANWPADLDLRGRRIGVIGSGASAMQVVPAIAPSVDHMVIFQRSPQWIAPFDKLHRAIPDPLRQLFKNEPLYRAWYWLRLFWQYGDRVIESLRKDPVWTDTERSVNSVNDRAREHFTRYIQLKLADRPDLVASCLPTYPPFGKRILMDNGWYDTLKQPNVRLETGAISRIAPGQVVLDDGTMHELDVLVLATGFEAARMVTSLEVHGRAQSLREAWDDDNGRAYLGISVPGFPNFFIIGGPNSVPGSGSFIFQAEMQMNYICELLAAMDTASVDAVEPRQDVFEQYSARVDELHEQTIWTHPGMDTYYRNDRGRVVFVSPFRSLDYWRMTRSADLAEYHCYRAGSRERSTTTGSS